MNSETDAHFVPDADACGTSDDFDLYVINSPKSENRTFAHNAAKEEKEPILSDCRFAAKVWFQTSRMTQ